jgi:hypothetical protein
MHIVNPTSIRVRTPGGSAVGGRRKRSWELEEANHICRPGQWLPRAAHPPHAVWAGLVCPVRVVFCFIFFFVSFSFCFLFIFYFFFLS